jgi:hypothetical protein
MNASTQKIIILKTTGKFGYYRNPDLTNHTQKISSNMPHDPLKTIEYRCADKKKKLAS